MEKAIKKYVDNNVIYTNQFAVIAFVVMIAFKISMLPSYMYETVGRDSWIIIGILLVLEAVMFMVALYVTKRINLLADDSKWLYVIHAIIYGYTMIRLVVLYSGLITYTSNSLFDQGRIDFIIIAFAIVIPYIVSRGGNTIARLFEIIFYFLAAILIVMVLTPSFKWDLSELTPIFGGNNGKLINGFTDYAVWFGDYVLLFYFTVKPRQNKFLSKASVPVALVFSIIGVVIFYVAFIAVYGEAGSLVHYAFNRMSVFNTISELLGATNFLSILVWMIMSFLQITLMFWTATNALMCIIKSKTIAIAFNILFVSFVEWFWVLKLENAHNFAIGVVKYFILACQIALPIALIIYAKIRSKEEV